MKSNPPNHGATPVTDGWYVSESTQKYDGQHRLITMQISGVGNVPAWTRESRTEGSGFVKQNEYQRDEAGRVSKLRVWTNYPPPAL